MAGSGTVSVTLYPAVEEPGLPGRARLFSTCQLSMTAIETASSGIPSVYDPGDGLGALIPPTR